MLIIVDSGKGQMANQLFFMAHVLASAYEKGFHVRFCNFHSYEGLTYSEKNIEECFDIKEIGKKNRFFVCTANIMKILKKRECLKLLNIRNGGEAKEIIPVLLRKNAFSRKDYYWMGWPYIDYFSLEKNALGIRKFFGFSEKVKKESEKVISCKKSILCGVHIRRGDYKIWRKGKYYFEDEVYMRIASEIKKYFNKEICFVLCSNEEISENRWRLAGFDIIVSKSDAVVDLCLLSKCDLLIGPPSTFSAWASFMGEVKRFVIDDCDKKFEYDSCRIGLVETDSFGNINNTYIGVEV